MIERWLAENLLQRRRDIRPVVNERTACGRSRGRLGTREHLDQAGARFGIRQRAQQEHRLADDVGALGAGELQQRRQIRLIDQAQQSLGRGAAHRGVARGEAAQQGFLLPLTSAIAHHRDAELCRRTEWSGEEEVLKRLGVGLVTEPAHDLEQTVEHVGRLGAGQVQRELAGFGVAAVDLLEHEILRRVAEPLAPAHLHDVLLEPVQLGELEPGFGLLLDVLRWLGQDQSPTLLSLWTEGSQHAEKGGTHVQAARGAGLAPGGRRRTTARAGTIACGRPEGAN